MALPLPRAQERRGSPRVAVALPVVLVHGARRLPGTCRDVAYEGLLVLLDQDLLAAEGELLRVELTPPEASLLLIPALVARRDGRRFGLRVFGFSGAPARAWQALVASILHGPPPAKK